MSVLKKKPGIIVALDMEDIHFATQLAEELSGARGNFAIKIGRPLEMQGGKDVISKIKNVSSIPIIYDGKIADIPYISAKIAAIAYSAGADAIIMHSIVGKDVIKEVMNLNKGDVIVVIEMTHQGAVEYFEPISEKLVRDATELKVDGVVLPATRPERVKRFTRIISANASDMYVISPGIKTQGAEPGDAIINGADYEVIGRAIYGAKEPKKAAEELYRRIINRLK